MSTSTAGFNNTVVYADNVDFLGGGGSAPQVTADGQLLIGSTASPNIRAGNLTSTGGTIGVTNGAGSINLEVISTMVWNEITIAGPTAMIVNQGYVANAAFQVNFTLPAASAIGDVLRVDGKGAGLFQIQQLAGQTVHFLGSDTTTGAGGSVTAQDQYGCLTLRCITANTDWVVESSIGNFTIV